MDVFFGHTGIIAEYNPFHNGHALHISKIRAQSRGGIVAMMSGQFVQRGEPALLDKWKRAEMALRNGADLVVELPLPWAMSGAETFARGGVSLLQALGCVETIGFGCETGRPEELSEIAAALLSEEYHARIQALLPTGRTFARLRSEALAELGVNPSPLDSPNNTLAVEYLKANLSLKAGLTPLAVRREGASHDSAEAGDGICSASYLRTLLHGFSERTPSGPEAALSPDLSPFMPESTRDILLRAIEKQEAPTSADRLERGILSVLRRMTAQEMEALPDVSEGLHNRLYSAVQSSCRVREILEKTKTKRYTMARIRRIVFSAYLGVPSGFSKQLPPYLRVLGLGERGREILAAARKTAALPILLRYADVRSLDAFGRDVFELEARAGDLFALSLPSIAPCARDKTHPAVQIR